MRKRGLLIGVVGVILIALIFALNGNWLGISGDSVSDVWECSDEKDNDEDGLIDFKDPGCWEIKGDPDTYDPRLKDEGRYTSECQDGIDNDLDERIDWPKDDGCEDMLDYFEIVGGPI